MTKQEKILDAIKTLKDAGYYTGNLWNITDVNRNHNCTDKEAYHVLTNTVGSDSIIEEINTRILETAEHFNLENTDPYYG